MIDNEPIDIRKIPIKSWSARELEKKASGRWMFFYKRDSIDPFIKIVPFSDDDVVLGKTISGHTSRELKTTMIEREEYLPDSYQLMSMRHSQEIEAQKLVIEPAASLPALNRIRSRSGIPNTAQTETNLRPEAPKLLFNTPFSVKQVKLPPAKTPKLRRFIIPPPRQGDHSSFSVYVK